MAAQGRTPSIERIRARDPTYIQDYAGIDLHLRSSCYYYQLAPSTLPVHLLRSLVPVYNAPSDSTMWGQRTEGLSDIRQGRIATVKIRQRYVWGETCSVALDVPEGDENEDDDDDDDDDDVDVDVYL
ncbi:hypothetical protein NM688_g4495 [Phlebia brevispora]|uniref:Uncharacterized protein n=1 Tax=Phlebia brevispora TaxID=194682 RepID=A0ACC1T2Z8_9APHY|nr:hypothetical protein NM688_g4495 [Phlebia brevispora]